MKSAANAFSYVFHPLLLTTYLVVLLGFYFPAFLSIKQNALMIFTIFIFIITFVFPILNVAFMLRWSGPAATFKLENRKDRIFPFILISLIYSVVAGLFVYKQISDGFNRLMMVNAALVVIGTIITFFSKISIHSLAMAGLTGILLALNKLTGGGFLLPVMVAVILSGCVMSSRLFLNAHTPGQVTAGAVVGLFVGFTGTLFLF